MKPTPEEELKRLEFYDQNLEKILERARALPDFPAELKGNLWYAHQEIIKEIRRREAGGDPDDYGGHHSIVHTAGDPIAGVVCGIFHHKWREYGPADSRKNCTRCRREESITMWERKSARFRLNRGFTYPQ